MVLRDPKYWRDPRYWRWWWGERLGADTKLALAFGAAGALVVAGVITADMLSYGEDSQTLTVPVAPFAPPAVSEKLPEEADVTGPAPGTGTVTKVATVFETVTRPGETNLETVRRNGRTLVVRKVVRRAGKTVTYPVKVPGPVRERVVTNERTETVAVTAPGKIETVTREVTQPARVTTVTTPGTTQTVTRELTQPARTVTETNTVTVTQEVTVTKEVTVTETVQGKPPHPPPPPTPPPPPPPPPPAPSP
jgi:hypothetical protein